MDLYDNLRSNIARILATQFPTWDLSEGSQLYTTVVDPLLENLGLTKDLFNDYKALVKHFATMANLDWDLNDYSFLSDIAVKAPALAAIPVLAALKQFLKDDYLPTWQILASLGGVSPSEGTHARVLIHMYMPEPVAFEMPDTVYATAYNGAVFYPAELPMIVSEGDYEEDSDYYRLDVWFEAADYGTDYNIDEDTITAIDGISFVSFIRNDAAIPGSAPDTVSTIQTKIDQVLYNRSLSTKTGIREYLRNTFGIYHVGFVSGIDEYRTSVFNIIAGQVSDPRIITGDVSAEVGDSIYIGSKKYFVQQVTNQNIMLDKPIVYKLNGFKHTFELHDRYLNNTYTATFVNYNPPASATMTARLPYILNLHSASIDVPVQTVVPGNPAVALLEDTIVYSSKEDPHVIIVDDSTLQFVDGLEYFETILNADWSNLILWLQVAETTKNASDPSIVNHDPRLGITNIEIVTTDSGDTAAQVTLDNPYCSLWETPCSAHIITQFYVLKHVADSGLNDAYIASGAGYAIVANASDAKDMFDTDMSAKAILVHEKQATTQITVEPKPTQQKITSSAYFSTTQKVAYFGSHPVGGPEFYIPNTRMRIAVDITYHTKTSVTYQLVSFFRYTGDLVGSTFELNNTIYTVTAATDAILEVDQLIPEGTTTHVQLQLPYRRAYLPTEVLLDSTSYTIPRVAAVADTSIDMTPWPGSVQNGSLVCSYTPDVFTNNEWALAFCNKKTTLINDTNSLIEDVYNRRIFFPNLPVYVAPFNASPVTIWSTEPVALQLPDYVDTDTGGIVFQTLEDSPVYLTVNQKSSRKAALLYSMQMFGYLELKREYTAISGISVAWDSSSVTLRIKNTSTNQTNVVVIPAGTAAESLESYIQARLPDGVFIEVAVSETKITVKLFADHAINLSGSNLGAMGLTDGSSITAVSEGYNIAAVSYTDGAFVLTSDLSPLDDGYYAAHCVVHFTDDLYSYGRLVAPWDFTYDKDVGLYKTQIQAAIIGNPNSIDLSPYIILKPTFESDGWSSDDNSWVKMPTFTLPSSAKDWSEAQAISDFSEVKLSMYYPQDLSSIQNIFSAEDGEIGFTPVVRYSNPVLIGIGDLSDPTTTLAALKQVIGTSSDIVDLSKVVQLISGETNLNAMIHAWRWDNNGKLHLTIDGDQIQLTELESVLI